MLWGGVWGFFFTELSSPSSWHLRLIAFLKLSKTTKIPTAAFLFEAVSLKETYIITVKTDTVDDNIFSYLFLLFSFAEFSPYKHTSMTSCEKGTLPELIKCNCCECWEIFNVTWQKSNHKLFIFSKNVYFLSDKGISMSIKNKFNCAKNFANPQGMWILWTWVPCINVCKYLVPEDQIWN